MVAVKYHKHLSLSFAIETKNYCSRDMRHEINAFPNAGFEPWPDILCCVLRQYTLLSQRLSPPRCINANLGT